MLAMDTAIRTDRNRQRKKQKQKYHIFNNPGTSNFDQNRYHCPDMVLDIESLVLSINGPRHILRRSEWLWIDQSRNLDPLMRSQCLWAYCNEPWLHENTNKTQGFLMLLKIVGLAVFHGTLIKKYFQRYRCSVIDAAFDWPV